MDALVCIKAVASEPPRVREEADGPVFERAPGARFVTNESDAYAVDECVRLARLHGGRVSVVTVGPLAGQEVLYAALAKGADEALRVDADVSDPLLVARLLAAVARRGAYDLVVTGIESREELASAVGPALAAYLDRPFAGAITRLELDPDARCAAVTRELGGGFFQTLELPLPVVLSVQSGICRLSYPPTVRVLQARRRRVESLGPAELGVGLDPPPARLVAISEPRPEREVELVEGSPAEVAGALLDRIDRALRG